MAQPTIAEMAKHAAREQGWAITNHGEAVVALALSRLGYRPSDFEMQFSLGPYRLDFAMVRPRIDLEADGWVHTAKDVRKRDRLRDRRLREWGWTVVRVDLSSDINSQISGRLPGARPEEEDRMRRALEASIDLAQDRMMRWTGRTPLACLEEMRSVISPVCRRMADRYRVDALRPADSHLAPGNGGDAGDHCAR